MLASCGRRILLANGRITGRRYVLTACEQKNLSSPLADVDNEMHDIIQRERKRQRESITLIPSENFTSKAVMDALGSEMQNKYSEGYPGARYYGGNEFIDQAERLCQKRALELFNLDPNQWGVNVQPLSGAPANLYAYSAVCQVGDRIMGLDLPHGGHLSHGYQTPSKKISFISKYFQTMPYRLDENTELIDYDDLAHTSSLFRPKVIVAGASAYSRFIDYERMKKISNNVGAYLLTDMAHVSGLIAAGVHPSPFPYSDIVTTTTHKSLRGPRGALIFYRKGIQKVTKKGTEIKYNLDQTINFSVFPGHQGGPHNHTISALAVALGQAARPDFIDYQKKVVSNASILANELLNRGFRLVSGGTDNHLILIDVIKSKGVNGSQVEKVLELINIAANKNTIPGDTSALIPGGLRIGTPAMTTRGFEDLEFKKVANYIEKAVEIAKRHSNSPSAKVTPEFIESVENDPETSKLRNEIITWVSNFSTP